LLLKHSHKVETAPPTDAQINQKYTKAFKRTYAPNNVSKQYRIITCILSLYVYFVAIAL